MHGCSDLVAECRNQRRAAVQRVVSFFRLDARENSILRLRLPRLDLGLLCLRGEARQAALTCLQHVILLLRCLSQVLDILLPFDMPINAFDLCANDEQERAAFSELFLSIAMLFHTDGMDMNQLREGSV